MDYKKANQLNMNTYMLSSYIEDNTKGVGRVLGARILSSINDFVETIVVEVPLEIEDTPLEIEDVVEETPLERVERRRNEFKLLKEKVKLKSNILEVIIIQKAWRSFWSYHYNLYGDMIENQIEREREGLTNRVLTTEEINDALIKRGII
jgi:hypothetical protein